MLFRFLPSEDMHYIFFLRMFLLNDSSLWFICITVFYVFPVLYEFHLRILYGVLCLVFYFFHWSILMQKREAPPGEKPEPVKTHLRNMIIVPEMIGSIIGIYNGKTFNQIEVKPEMIGHYLAEFSISYKPVKHGRPGIGATHSSRFIPLK